MPIRKEKRYCNARLRYLCYYNLQHKGNTLKLHTHEILNHRYYPKQGGSSRGTSRGS